MSSQLSTTAFVPFLVRISDAFAGIADDILKQFGAVSCKRLASEYYWIRTATPAAVRQSRAAAFARWNLPLDHAWPCNPSKMDGFIEKAAQALLQKFGAREPQAILVGVLNPGSPDRYFKNLAAKLRDRALRLFPPLAVQNPEQQDPEAETLFALVGKEGLFCGMQSPRASNGFYPGGSKFVATNTPDTISRAGAKIAEALHYLGLYRLPLPPGSRWLELGACPGGMTSELLARKYLVTAIDVAALDTRLDNHPGLTFIRSNVARYHPSGRVIYDALLCDMNGPAAESIKQVIRLSRHLAPRAIAIFTLKLPRVESVEVPLALFEAIVTEASAGGLRLCASTHLTYNRHEFTLFFEPFRSSSNRNRRRLLETVVDTTSEVPSARLKPAAPRIVHGWRQPRHLPPTTFACPTWCAAHNPARRWHTSAAIVAARGGFAGPLARAVFSDHFHGVDLLPVSACVRRSVRPTARRCARNAFRGEISSGWLITTGDNLLVRPPEVATRTSKTGMPSSSPEPITYPW